MNMSTILMIIFPIIAVTISVVLMYVTRGSSSSGSLWNTFAFRINIFFGRYKHIVSISGLNDYYFYFDKITKKLFWVGGHDGVLCEFNYNMSALPSTVLQYFINDVIEDDTKEPYLMGILKAEMKNHFNKISCIKNADNSFGVIGVV